ncbi:MAG TPA: adenosylcobalamin-dependent ribonucleoside-diphosphate reductase [Bacilli bacterium]|jgi:ribonucleoside-diphosphate reductase alpha chain|nr:adenosylcobalamin-dependent ribonucleoside-diphosphate reductase [Bacilli bacterium]
MADKTLKIYTKEEVQKATLEYFKGDELATDVWIKKYCLKDENNYYELTPDDMHRRIAKELARIEKKYPNPISEDEIYETLKEFKRIIPQGSPMSGIGNDFQVISLSNCYVIGNKGTSDSYGGILKIDQEQIQLMKRRGGVGHDLSHIRPAGSPVKNSAITSTGIVPFMERYSNSTKEVAQDGRRGALMLSISIEHPDAEKFIDAKLEQGKVTGANISVKLTDEFMRRATQLEDNEFWQTYPIDLKIPLGEEYDKLIINAKEGDLIYLPDVGYLKKINAKKLWKKIIHNAWKSAEPGILFWDKIIGESIPDCYADEGFTTVSTNPCAELPLCPYDSCRLFAINLYGYVVNPFTKDAHFNWELFKSDVQIAQRYMDDIVDLELEKIDAILRKIDSDPEDDFIKIYERRLWENIKDMASKGRRTGLGITAEGDMLAALGLTYGTDKAIEFSENVHRLLKLMAYRSSTVMSLERGSFPIYNKKNEMNNPFINRIREEDKQLYDDMIAHGRRNIALLTIAPTGSVSIMSQTTSGIEPAFEVFYKRRRKINAQEKDIRIDFVDDEGVAWQEYPVFHHKFETWLELNGYDIEQVKNMSDNELNEILKKSPYYKATANDVDWVKKVEMQGRIQQHVDHSISVTVNLPKDITEEMVAKVYETGWKSGCKGLTVYRDGSRSGVLISSEKKTETPYEIHVPKRPKRLKAHIHRFQNNLEKWIAVVGLMDGRPYEIFTGKLENGLSYLPSNIKECEVVKNKFEVEEINEEGKTIKVTKKRYDIEYIDSNSERQVHTGLNQAFNPEFWNYAKLVSGVLRQRMPIYYVWNLVDSLNFREDHINTWKNGVARVIKKYIKDGVEVNKKCPNCGSNHLEFKEGCLTCMGCGNSKCG